ncbi:MAG TPA: 50S ribosomal protein L13 [Chthonomonas sp.]|jgi:large subunit ribosomal protein L13|uniref:50S ribosomal protein L13 n=1 Tax=Chthonomonas sp. TaxID=2282153 RepID=UPI002B4B65E9|nr:50S ribosomal protein L13 [Chthonomonas sp.]HLH81546.1 50S ribosomal protein L13 [Chthonomonas sp.]
MRKHGTYFARKEDVEAQRVWYVVDATGRPLGRLAAEVARLLRGKHKPIFTPNVDTGDHVIVINAEKVVLTGRKSHEVVRHHSGWPGALKEIERRYELERHPEEAIRRVVRGMLPHNRLGDAIIKKLKVYRGPEHPHAAQKPIVYQSDAQKGGE